MCNNKVQFQVGYSCVSCFKAMEQEAIAMKLYSNCKLRWPTGFSCLECGYHQYCFF